MRYQIDIRLKRYESALRHLVRMGNDEEEEEEEENGTIAATTTTNADTTRATTTATEMTTTTTTTTPPDDDDDAAAEVHFVRCLTLMKSMGSIGSDSSCLTKAS